MPRTCDLRMRSENSISVGTVHWRSYAAPLNCRPRAIECNRLNTRATSSCRLNGATRKSSAPACKTSVVSALDGPDASIKVPGRRAAGNFAKRCMSAVDGASGNCVSSIRRSNTCRCSVQTASSAEVLTAAAKPAQHKVAATTSRIAASAETTKIFPRDGCGMPLGLSLPSFEQVQRRANVARRSQSLSDNVRRTPSPISQARAGSVTVSPATHTSTVSHSPSLTSGV